ncbi:MAG: DUF4037 domain-containing protein [Anaerolineae bacterium]|nr:DUF4037 domain-containing protein [Anaerolineae bacterium]
MAVFIPGIELSRRLYLEAVRPILDRHFPDLPHAAAHVGSGSDVLGYDTEMSSDHFWGLAVHLFLRTADADLKDAIHRLMGEELPLEIAGYPVGYGDSEAEAGMDVMRRTSARPLRHHVWAMTVEAFLENTLHWTPGEGLTAADWLSFPQQNLLEVTAGAVHFDGVGEITSMRDRLAWYPHDVWLYLMACGWQRIGQEEHLMPRAGYVGDELGSALIGSRLVRDVMSLCFLMERRYAPYPKWFGTAFARLSCAGEMTPLLRRAQGAATWQEREQALGEAFSALARRHNRLGVTPPLPENPSPFFGRPFQVIHGSDFAAALLAAITDPEVQGIASRGRIGSIDQFSDSTDLHEAGHLRSVVRQLYNML